MAVSLLTASCAGDSGELAELKDQVAALEEKLEEATTTAPATTVAPTTSATTTSTTSAPVPTTTTTTQAQATTTTTTTTTTQAPATTTTQAPATTTFEPSDPCPADYPLDADPTQLPPAVAALVGDLDDLAGPSIPVADRNRVREIARRARHAVVHISHDLGMGTGSFISPDGYLAVSYTHLTLPTTPYV